MPTTAALAPALADPLKGDDPDPHPRDSRLLDFSSVPIPEEDEGTETASEPLEPTTPTSHSSDAVPFTHPFRHDEPVESLLVSQKAANQVDPKSLPSLLPPLLPPTAPEMAPPRTITRTMSNMKSAAQPPDQVTTAPPEKPGLSKRVGSFVRHKLHRTPSHKDKPASTPQPDVKTEKLAVNAGPDDSSEISIPAASMPKYRRLSSFSLSARNSPRSSHGNSPPSPSSPTSTISDEQATTERKLKLTQKQSASSAALSGMNSKRPGITWAGGGKEGKRGGVFTRRRSASSEQVPRTRANDEKETVGLIDTFSTAAPVGVGMKARRLSLSLPDEFVVDCCELDKEFKSSSLMPGKRGKRLGQGATAEVRIMARRGAFSKEDLVAVKEFREREKDETEDDYIKKIKSEYSIAKSLHHPNIVETVRLCTNRGRWNHVMEFCSGGELFTLVERKLFVEQGGYYSSDDRLCFFKQLLRGVDYLHSHGIAHRDIKLENLLLSREGHLKISDFGVAEVFCGEHPGLRAAGGECGKNMGEIRLSNPGICGSLPYIAPEVLEKKSSYDPRPLDVWSCAIVYLTMTFGGCPWQAAKTEFDYYAKFKKGWDDWLDGNPDREITDGADGHPKCGRIFGLINSPAVKRLILKMLHPIPERRLTIRQVINTSIYKTWGCCCPESYDDPACCFDTTKCPSKQPRQITKKLLHHHIPPKPENKIAAALQHRFDMGDGWS